MLYEQCPEYLSNTTCTCMYQCSRVIIMPMIRPAIWDTTFQPKFTKEKYRVEASKIMTFLLAI